MKTLFWYLGRIEKKNILSTATVSANKVTLPTVGLPNFQESIILHQAQNYRFFYKIIVQNPLKFAFFTLFLLEIRLFLGIFCWYLQDY